MLYLNNLQIVSIHLLIGSLLFFISFSSDSLLATDSTNKDKVKPKEKPCPPSSQEQIDSSKNIILFAKTGAFENNTVVQIARELSRKPYTPPTNSLPSSLENLSYDDYREIRFKPDSAIWKSEGLPFQLQLFHRGSYYQDRVEIAIVEGNKAAYLPYNRDFFTIADEEGCKLPTHDIGYGGFRIHFPLNNSAYFDELIVFQGASYFRALGKGNIYGLSARGLTINTAEPAGEEFPIFKAFWIEKPSKGSNQIVVHALLDSPSVTGAYRFSIRPGEDTITDVEVILFPRVELAKAGLAPITSMYLHSMNDRIQTDDYRPQVHDSDGLMIFNGRNEYLWRPLANPKKLQVSTFMDNGVQGFGLMQRERHFQNYEDLEVHYEKRPSLWVVPTGNWGEGSVVLVEIPTPSEIHDNITVFWLGTSPLKAGTEFIYSYRLLWGYYPTGRKNAIYISRTASGRADILKPTLKRLFVIDYGIQGEKPDKMPTPSVEATAGTINNIVIRDNPISQGYRLSFEFDPLDNDLSELRVDLKTNGQQPIESWLYRYTR